MRSLFVEGSLTGLSDGQFVDRYLARRDELAFEALVDRHAPMVLAVCRRSLANAADLDDAFQATFLVLARRSRTVCDRDGLGGWLFGVCRRVCLLANRARRRRLGHERRAAEQRTASDATVASPRHDELGAAIYEEIERLPQTYRLPVVLCLLEGRTRSEAAGQLCWTEGMVRGRLARAKVLLRARLIRRGLAPGAALTALAREATAAGAVPRSSIENAARYAASRHAAAGLASANSAALAEGVIRTMVLKNLTAAAVAVLVVAGLTAWATSLVAGEDKTPATGTPPISSAVPPTAPRHENLSRVDKREEPADFELWRKKAQLELKSLQAQLDAKKAEITQRESEYQVKQLTRNLAVFNALEKSIPLSFARETPLEDVLKYVKKETSLPALPSGIPIYVDPEGLRRVGKSMSSRVRIDLQGVPLGTTLRLLLKQLGLTYEVNGGLLIISSPGPFQ